MKTTILAVSLSAALVAWPSIAQQGPAGVPGAYGLAESVAPTPPAAPAMPAQRAKRGSADCVNARDVEQCKARQEAHKKMLEACKDKFGAERNQCMHKQTQAIDCTEARNPQQCESRKQANVQCQNGAQFRQCVQQKMPQTDCSKSPDPVRCEQHQKARLLCQDKTGPEHRQCLRDNLTAKK